ncbi:tetratricopeptide repeat protein [Archangium sp.]|uniref:tetratricopeptide repeat protein n=1 Tax=Archangium sp. TaxID=1872627 RepID=UPI002D35725A|nr:tetratricopeptide repeat protein [Archangium sp.]HYO52341.1 tetratricopeptide repeat protein [Archangium sp.]
MYNLLIALGVGLAITLGIKLSGIGSIWAGIIPGTIAFVGTYLLLARRIGNQLQALMGSVQKELQTQPTNQKDAQARVERAIKMLEGGLAYDKWQFMVGPEIHSQIGMLKYMSKDLDGAQVHFAKASPRNYMAKAMQGALYYQRKDFPAMKKSFEAAVSAGKKEPLVWAAYAWCLVQNKEKDEALKVLGRGVEANPSDEKLKNSLSALQNDKRLKMKPYEPMWWQFGLETPPPQVLGGGGGGRRVQFNPRR